MGKKKEEKTVEPVPKKSKPGPKKKKPIPIISIDLYQKMYAAYLERQSAAHVSRATGVAETTAQRYIEKGYPKRGLDPLKDRLKKINEMTRAQQDYDIARSRVEFQKAARAAFMKATQRIQQMDPSELDANKIPDHLNKLMTVIERTFGEAEHTHEMKGQFSSWSIAELRAYLENGITPDK